MGATRPGSLAGLHVDRPAAGDLHPGTLWESTDQDGGTLYRTDGSTWTQVAASVNASASSPLTTKGDLYTHDGTADARQAVGATGRWLKANAATTNGIEWADPPGAYAETIGDGATTSFAITHNLATEDVHVQVWDVSGADPVLANGDPSSVTATDSNTVTVAFGSAPSTDQYRVAVLASAAEASLPDLLHVQDQKASGTPGGDFNTGAWRTRDLNTAVTNEITGASLASNQITLPAGTYEVEWSAPAFQTYRHATRLQDVTNATTLLSGTGEFASADAGNLFGQTRSFGRGRFTLASSAAIEIQHRCQSSRTGTGFGVDAGFAFTVATEVYADIRIRQLSA